AINLNRTTFKLASDNAFSSFQCLDEIAASPLEIIIKSFPASCRPFDGVIFLEKIAILSDLSKFYKLDHGSDAFAGTGLLSPAVMENTILLSKKVYDKSVQENIDLASQLNWLRTQFEKPQLRNILNSLVEISKSFSEEEKLRFQSQSLKVVSGLLLHESDLQKISKLMEDYAKWHGQEGHRSILSLQYPSLSEDRTCRSELNQNIGGSVCPDFDQFSEFIKNFSILLKRKNNDSPLAIRQFLTAMDPAVGLQIPLGSRNTKAKVLSIHESLKMFWDLTDKSLPINKINMPYEIDGKKKDEEVTTMERIEVVI